MAQRWGENKDADMEKSLGRPKIARENNIKFCLEHMSYETINCTKTAQDRVKWTALMAP